ncbi:MAG TPA: endonuclease domain-containing protein [Allosphingosinicella sp.]|nr:endonuclease domain-containing protein [Allosphingosinicella sp.]
MDAERHSGSGRPGAKAAPGNVFARGLAVARAAKAPAGLKFRRQHPAGPYILDFACMESRLAVEIDGEAHSAAEVALHDDARDEWLANQGFRTLRIPARDVLVNLQGVIQMLALQADPAQPLHQPSAGPPPRTGEDLC